MVSGCLLGEEKPDLAIDVPARFDNAGANPDAALPSLSWWAKFRSRELTRLIEVSREANFDIAAAVGRVLQADALSRVAGSALLPTISASANGTRSRASQSTGTGASFSSASGIVSSGSGSASERNAFSATLSASYEIDFWGKNQSALRAAEENAIYARFDRETVELTTIASVANAYFQVLAARDRLRIARGNLASAERIMRTIQSRLQVGTASDLETSQQQTLVAQTRASIPLLEQTTGQSVASLALLLGLPPEGFRLTGTTLNALAMPRVTPGLPSDVLTQRPDVRRAEAQLAAANANVYNARAQMFPSITLTGSAGYQSFAIANLFRPEAAFYNMAFGVTQPIFDGLRLQGNLENQQGRQEELLQNYRKAIISSFTDVENALIAVKQTALREQLQREAATFAQRAFSIVEQRLNEGTVDITTVLSTQQTFFNAQDAVAQARLAHLLAIISLNQALGGSWAAQTPRLVPIEAVQ